MADITRRLFLRHLRGAPTAYVRHVVRGRVRHEGVGTSFWYRPLHAVLSEVPVDDRELPLLFHARTADFADVTVQATVTYRMSDPGLAATRLDFSIDPLRGGWRGQPLDQVATLLAELAQQPALDLLARVPLTEALAGIATVREAVASALAGDQRLAEIGASVVSSRVVAIRPEPEVERALQTPTREAVQQEADRASYARRAVAVEQERAIAENELQNKIELARREQQLVEQRGANDRRAAELEAAAKLVSSQGQTDRARLAAESERAREQARADGVRAVGLASAEAEVARLAAYRDVPEAVLYALALEKLAGQLPQIGELTITPDVVTKLVGRLANGHGER
ncbi:SPFH domain-containing protein [Phytohabitans sp. ZYX-F-186]|uniref:SPFH domain-containing protein n=1 Tax=Phytohabitans maris TaxID=3071409 RepID=A0ABU0ZWI6_9ACTN|nr:SPFH domain-containing protein [Phytohabitans sp. ZYX-F-186]MDQ7904376.1 SPFH domain-containing protein [Phytohabitans sp. ZYX-F-186]MDQ7911403.1 SPFH domain-containing protein [Phytohabitans sp. ZYX-F-186]